MATDAEEVLSGHLSWKEVLELCSLVGDSSDNVTFDFEDGSSIELDEDSRTATVRYTDSHGEEQTDIRTLSL